MKTFLILGAGTAGTLMAREMAHALDLNQWKVIVVDKEEQHYYQPGFLFIPFGYYKRDDVVKPIRSFVAKGVEYVVSNIEALEPAENKVTLANGRVIQYDYLVVALGSRPNYYGIPGAAEFAYSLKSLDDGVTLRNQILQSFEQAACEPDPERRQSWLTFTIVGGGATGVEFAGAVVHA